MSRVAIHSVEQDGQEVERQFRHPRQAKWREQNPLKVWAHASLRSALRRGLVTPQPCAICGAAESEAHHEDHALPLDVTWLCRAHHKARHAEMPRVPE